MEEPTRGQEAAAPQEQEQEQACPICLEGRGVTTSSWAITACGHEGCFDCMDAAVAERRQ